MMNENDILNILKKRFHENESRHIDVSWEEVENRLMHNIEKLKILIKMEYTLGEPDVIGKDEVTGEYIFCDCSKETPKSRTNICYDLKGEELRIKKEVFPSGNAITMAHEIGIDILTEDEYIYLQSLGEFDTKTSSWLKTPTEVREKGGAIFGDHRFGRTFIYHNSAQSFYSVRGFRGILRV